MSKRTNAKLDELVDRVERLPASAGVVRRLLELARRHDYRLDDVVACIERDPGLAARLLQVVNSSRYALRQRVASLRRAAMLLGPSSLRLLAISFSVLSVFNETLRRPRFRGFWARSGCLATLAGEVSRLSVDTRDDDCYVAGLLADTGVLVFASTGDETYDEMYDRSAAPGTLCEAETEIHGFDHAMLGRRLLERWELPEAVFEAVGEHHASGALDSAEAQCVRTAQLVVDAATYPEPAVVANMTRAFETVYGVGEQDLERFLEHSRRAVETDAAAMGGGNGRSPIDRESIERIIGVMHGEDVAVAATAT